MAKKSKNPIVRMWQFFVRFLNNIVRGWEKNVPMEQLGEETLESYGEQLNKNMHAMANAGGSIGRMKLALSQAQQMLASQKANLQRHIKSMENITGEQLAAATRTRDSMLRMYARTKAMVEKQQLALERGLGRQQTATFMVQDFVNQQQEARSEIGLMIAEDNLYDVEEALLDAQMAAAGVLGDAELVDHRQTMRERNAERGGRIEGKSQFLDAVYTAQGKALADQPSVLTTEEQSLLAEVYADAGVPLAVDETDVDALAAQIGNS